MTADDDTRARMDGDYRSPLLAADASSGVQEQQRTPAGQRGVHFRPLAKKVLL